MSALPSIQITVTRAQRAQRQVPAAYEAHREALAAKEVTEIEGVPLVTQQRAIRECAPARLATDLLEEAINQGRDQGLLTARQARGLAAELEVDRVAVGRA